ncbi:CoA pyrophosphatase [Pelistega sp. NLN82]|uniref:CoA pyrophosphatase n=1 Tax=Pelistega ratti TaxID=2652177 RepID=A0A6L9Y4M7_9BURK|nr:CoA pyrophosphatase [Pelistega ratti]NEN75196.1 CoA pyrophosphatase [Pelistega ratti]
MQQQLSGNPLFDPRIQKAKQANHQLFAIPEAWINVGNIERALAQGEIKHDFFMSKVQQEKYPQALSANYTKAAVLVPIIQKNHQLELLLTQRSLLLEKHRGQISFPGGKQDIEDKNLEETALRETFEEIGITASHIHVMGQLPSVITGTGFSVMPFVAIVDERYTLSINREEVEMVFSVPLHFLLNPDNHYIHEVEIGHNLQRHYFSMTWQNHFIWGITAMIIRQFYLQCEMLYRSA